MNSFFYRLFVIFIAYFLSMSYLYAWAEENACFDILKEKTNSLYGVDIANVFNWTSNVDISTYARFQSKKYRPTGNPGGFFNSQRNNIGTIILPVNYITTQYVPIGSPTNFKFPINTSGSLIGTEFSNFRNQMVYTHHNIFDGTSFLSCGYLKITPYAGYTLNDLDPSNYFTNIIDGGWFEIEDSREVNLGAMGTGHYIIWKSVVQWATKLWTGSGTKLEKLFKVDIVSVIYDNGSTYFNEYETYPLQVDAMTNADTFTTAWSLQQDFAARVMNQTCLSFVHPNTGSLSPVCLDDYRSLSSQTRWDRSFAFQKIPLIASQESFFRTIFSLLIPQASAALESDELKEVQSWEDISKNGIGNTIMMDSNFDYFEYQKINSLPSKTLKDYIFSATNYQVELDLRRSVESGATLSEYETVLLWCGISYPERVKLIKKWIQWLDVTKFSLENIEYPDPKLGDCVLPFPDRRNADKIIEWSFESNKKYARYLNDIKNSTSDVRIQNLKKKLQEIEKEYASTIQRGNMLISWGKTLEWGKILSAAALEYEPQIEKIQNEMRTILNPESSPSLKEEKKLVPYLLIVFWFFTCLMVVFIIRNKKSQQVSDQ